MSSDADKVRAAADYIERVGLHKGSATDCEEAKRRGIYGDDYEAAVAVENDIPCCTLGALWGHGFDPYVWMPDGRSRDLLAHFIGAHVPNWNDAPERTAEEVVTKLREFADHLDAQPE